MQKRKIISALLHRKYIPASLLAAAALTTLYLVQPEPDTRKVHVISIPKRAVPFPLQTNSASHANALSLPKSASTNWLTAVRRNIEESEYEIRWQPAVNAYQSPNRAHNLRFTYFTNGFQAEPRVYANTAATWRVGLQLAAVRKGDVTRRFDGAALSVRGNTAEAKTDVCRIEYQNDRTGMRQNFIVDKRPEGSGKLELAFNADLKHLQMEVVGPADGLAFVIDEPGGVEVMRYRDLKVFDASNQLLVASIQKNSATEFSILVDDKDAKYPILIDPLSTSANFSAEGNQTGANFGWAVATAGDVDGDGYSDVIIGAPGYDGGQTDEGRVFIYCGTSTGLDTTADWTAESDQAGAQFGYAVSTAGDITADGYSDILVGAPSWYDSVSGYTNAGAVFMWYGGSTGPGSSGTPSNADWQRPGTAQDMALGFSVSTAGDVNGDGYSDIVVGAPFDDGIAAAGHVYSYHGGASGLGTAILDASDAQDSSMFGFSVALAGDLNADGYSDVIVSAPFYDDVQDDKGKVFLLIGSASGLGSSSWTATGEQEDDTLGWSLSGGGDVNGDGYSDIIIGAPGKDGTYNDEGKVYVYHGNTSPILPSSANWTARSDQLGAFLGYSVSMMADVNADGFADVIVGAPQFDNGQTDEGKVFVWFGSASGLGTSGLPSNSDWSVEQNTADALLGYSVATAGDINGDGYSDVVIGAAAYNGGQTAEGKAFAYHGGGYGLIASGWVTEGNQTNAHFGENLASAGDVNGDGFSDVIIGAKDFDNGQTNEGKVFVYHGSASGLSGTPNWVAESDQPFANFGHGVASAGDVNGDGYSDIIVGASRFDAGQTNEGKVFLWYGSSTGLGNDGTTNNADWQGESDQMDAEFGLRVASAGDVNGDGYDDILVSAYEYDSGETNEGKVFVWYGSSTGLGANGTPANADWTAESDDPTAGFGLRVASAGDVNGDGYADIMVAAPHFGSGQSDEGKVFLWYGGSGGLGLNGTTNNADWTAESDQASAQMHHIASAGDVNGDGYSDVLIGARLYDNGQQNEGKMFAWYGSSSGLGANGTPANADWSYEVNQTNAYLGVPASAGDVNGDGYGDVVISAGAYDHTELDEGAVFLFLGGSSGISTTYDEFIVGGEDHAAFGGSFGGAGIASAGDVNGDGFSDIIIDSRLNNGEEGEGRVFLYYGNKADAVDVKPRQWRTDLSTPVQPKLLTGSSSQVGLGLYPRTFFGRTDVKVQYEIKALGTAFNGQSLDTTSSWIDVTPSVAQNTLTKSGLSSGTYYKWRARLKYRLTDGAPQPYGRWIYPSGNSPMEADFRTN
jgi:hypothetical protein